MQVHASGACACRADSPAEFRSKKRAGKMYCFVRTPKDESLQEGRNGTRTLVKLGLTAEPRNDIQPYVSTGRASVVNLSRSSFGSGEIIVRSRNSKRRPGRPLPKGLY